MVFVFFFCYTKALRHLAEAGESMYLVCIRYFSPEKSPQEEQYNNFPEGSVGKGFCHQAWWPEIDHWDPRGGRREPILESSLWPPLVHCGTPQFPSNQIINVILKIRKEYSKNKQTPKQTKVTRCAGVWLGVVHHLSSLPRLSGKQSLSTRARWRQAETPWTRTGKDFLPIYRHIMRENDLADLGININGTRNKHHTRGLTGLRWRERGRENPNWRWVRDINDGVSKIEETLDLRSVWAKYQAGKTKIKSWLDVDQENWRTPKEAEKGHKRA